MSDLEAPESMTGNVFHGEVSTGEGGTVNAFGGDQHNNYYLSVSALRRRIRYASDPARLDRELRLVVPPPGLERDLAALRSTRLLVLCGGSRTGLSTAARQRWRAFAAENPARRAEELFASDEHELVEELGELKRASVLLLDVSHDKDFAMVLTERYALIRAALDEQDSFLVLAVGEAAFSASTRALPGAVHRIGRPDPIAVMEKRMQDAPLLDRLTHHDAFTRAVGELWPPQAVQAAAILDEASPGATVDALVKDLESGLKSWFEELRVLFEDRLTTAPSRALAVATSALEGAERDSVYFAARVLSEAAGETADPSVLADPSLHQSFQDLDAELVSESSSFQKSGYGEAVLAFAWREFPTWRAPIRAWLDRLLRPHQLEDGTLAVLLPRLLSFAAATGAADLVTGRAATIAGDGAGARLRRELAAGLLVSGALDPVVGQQVRAQLWRWSYHRSGVPIALQRTVALVCGDPGYAVRFPRNALTRLKHLLRSESQMVTADATAALVSAAGILPSHTVIEQLAEWAGGGSDPETRGVIPALLVALVEDRQVREQWSGDRLARDHSGAVTALWHGVLTAGAPAAVREAVAAWLDFAAAAPPEYRAPLADRLIAGTDDDFWALGQLSHALSDRAWAGRPSESDAAVLRDHLAATLAQAKDSV
ncbi:hypothetical protein [Glycomyces terrestris]|uniref:Uncharacterized protein n=1 Tax=Glycomyces terrestris TaxID=2493553 RepID=A0A426UZX1_9ACTN|nr:hypothetical protein [Glycomyces terrestris]RRS00160.1 hypothetical protein EIW28_06080 [Glycomyces terrestris]